MSSLTKTCRQCAKNFNLGQEDLEFYDKVSPVIGGQKFALPRLCPQQRFTNRLSKHRPFALREAVCANCQKLIYTALSIDEKCIPCKPCYLKRYYS